MRTDLTSEEKKKKTMDNQKTVQQLDPAFAGILNSVKGGLGLISPPPPGQYCLKKRDGVVWHRCAYIHFSNQLLLLVKSDTQLDVPMKA